MDLNTLREAAIEATARALDERLGYVPSDDSDEWEEEYRRQFAVLSSVTAAISDPPRRVRRRSPPAPHQAGPN